jgi:hypothetical protein
VSHRLGRKVIERRKVADGRGRIWTVSKVPWREAEKEDFRFWYEELTAEERVEAMAEALESCLKTRGLDGIPRLRRVHRRIRAPWAKLRSEKPRADKLKKERGVPNPRGLDEP